MTRDQLFSVATRELTKLVRTRSVLALGLLYGGIVVGLAAIGGASGYVPLALSLVRPIELLVPLLAVALGYRAILGDFERGDLETIRTYPVSRWTYVFGVYLGRLSVLVILVVVPLVIAAALVPLVGGPQSSVIATHPGLDSPLLYVRFVVFAALYAMVILSTALAISALSRSTRQGILLGSILALMLVVGLDLGIVVGLADGWIPATSLRWALTLSPASAFRFLVKGTVLGPLTGTGDPPMMVASVVSLLLWLICALGIAGWMVWPAERVTLISSDERRTH